MAYINAAAASVADLLTAARQPIKDTVVQTDRFAGQVEADHDYVDDLVKTLPDAYQMLARQGLYGDYFGFYLCDAILKLNGKGGQPVFVKLAGQDTGRCAPEMTQGQFKRPKIKPLAERNRLVVGVVGIGIVVAVVVAVFSYDKIPFVNGTTDYSAYFAEAGGIKPGSDVRVSGLSVGRVSEHPARRDEGAGRLHRRRRRRTGRPDRGIDQDRDGARHQDARDDPAR